MKSRTGGRSIPSQFDHGVEREVAPSSSRENSGPSGTRQAQVERMHGEGFSQNRSTNQLSVGVRQMSNCLDERPFTVDDSFSCAGENPRARSTVPTQRRDPGYATRRGIRRHQWVAFSLDQGGAGRVTASISGGDVKPR